MTRSRGRGRGDLAGQLLDPIGNLLGAEKRRDGLRRRRLQPCLLGLGETHLDAADIARRRRNLPQERRVLPCRKLLLPDLGGPLGDFLAFLVSERDDHGRHVDRCSR